MLLYEYATYQGKEDFEQMINSRTSRLGSYFRLHLMGQWNSMILSDRGRQGVWSHKRRHERSNGQHGCEVIVLVVLRTEMGP